MEVIEPNGVSIYNVSVGKTVPIWSVKNKRRVEVLPNTPDSGELELIQGFSFPTFGSKLRATDDGNYIFSSGMHPPQIKCFSTRQASLHYEKHLDCEIEDFKLLTKDGSKLAILRKDRYIEFFAKSNPYYKLKMPVFGRGLVYNAALAELNLFGASNDVYRLNLEHGKYFKSYSTSLPEIGCAALNPAFGILAVGGMDEVECWDPRDRVALASLKISQLNRSCNGDSFENDSNFPSAITALSFSQNGLTMGIGTSAGNVSLYDIRSNISLLTKDHQFDCPIIKIDFEERTKRVISSCKKILRIWDIETGDTFANIEPFFDMNDALHIPNTGMIMVAGENPRMNIYYIPELGPAPKWADFLDSVTEELNQEKASLYQDYRFVTQEQLEELSILNLIGTPYLRGYMHGYFMDSRLYEKIRVISKPDEYKQYIESELKKKLEAKRANRIAVQVPANSIKVNSKFFEVLSEKKSELAEKVLNDPRFKRIWEDPNMTIDANADVFKNTKFGEAFKEKFIEVKDLEDNDVEMTKDKDKNDCDDSPKDSERCMYGLNSDDHGLPLNKKDKNSSKDNSDKITTVDTQDLRLKSRNPEKIRKAAVKKSKLLVSTEENRGDKFLYTPKVDNANMSFAKRLIIENDVISRITNENIAVSGPIQTTFDPDAENKKGKIKMTHH